MGEEERVNIEGGEEKKGDTAYILHASSNWEYSFSLSREFAVELRYCMHSAQVRVIIVTLSDKEVQSGLCRGAVREEKRGSQGKDGSVPFHKCNLIWVLLI